MRAEPLEIEWANRLAGRAKILTTMFRRIAAVVGLLALVGIAVFFYGRPAVAPGHITPAAPPGAKVGRNAHRDAPGRAGHLQPLRLQRLPHPPGEPAHRRPPGAGEPGDRSGGAVAGRAHRPHGHGHRHHAAARPALLRRHAGDRRRCGVVAEGGVRDGAGRGRRRAAAGRRGDPGPRGISHPRGADAAGARGRRPIGCWRRCPSTRAR